MLELNSLCKNIFYLFLANSQCFPFLKKWTSEFPVPWQPWKCIADVCTSSCRLRFRSMLWWSLLKIPKVSWKVITVRCFVVLYEHFNQFHVKILLTIPPTHGLSFKRKAAILTQTVTQYRIFEERNETQNLYQKNNKTTCVYLIILLYITDCFFFQYLFKSNMPNSTFPQFRVL